MNPGSSPGNGLVLFDENNLPVFEQESYEEHTSAWIMVDGSIEGHRWALGAVAASLTKRYGDDIVGNFASDVKSSKARIYQYAKTYQVFQKCTRVHFLSFRHHTIAARAEDPERIIELADHYELSTRELDTLVHSGELPQRHRTIEAADAKEPQIEIHPVARDPKMLSRNELEEITAKAEKERVEKEKLNREKERKEAEHERKLAERRERAASITSNQWLHGSWEKYLPTLDDGSISLLLTDPPYGMSYRSNHRHVRHNAIDNDDERGALENLADMLRAAKSKLTVDAHLLVFTSPRLEPAFREVIAGAGFTLRSFICWTKNNTGMGDLTGTFAPKHERLIHAAWGDPKMNVRAPDSFQHARVTTENHPTEKPISLLKELINATTKEGEAVLDPYGGVASTLVAAESSGRVGLGCELDENYHAYGLVRLSELLEVRAGDAA